MALWTLDTCGDGLLETGRACQVETDADGLAIRHVRVCPAHAKLGWNHKAVEAENNRKNIAIGRAISGKAIEASEVGWAIDAGTRNLTIVHPLLSARDAETAVVEASALKPGPETAVKTADTKLAP